MEITGKGRRIGEDCKWQTEWEELEGKGGLGNAE